MTELGPISSGGLGRAPRRPIVLAVASKGGHWEQLMLLRDGLTNCDVIFVTTVGAQLGADSDRLVKRVPDFNARQPFRLLRGSLHIGHLILALRPAAIISTGAAPGLIALLIGRLIGAHTIWIDSIANSSRLSLSGRLARPVARLWLTQWQHLATPQGPHYRGSVL